MQNIGAELFPGDFRHAGSAALALPPSELKTLAAGIRSGRLSAPYAPSGLSRFVGGSIAASVSLSLQAMSDAGLPPAGAAYSLELLASALSERPAAGEMVDSVTTCTHIRGHSKSRHERGCLWAIS